MSYKATPRRRVLPLLLVSGVVLGGLVLSGCGRKGEPEPPLRFLPAPTTDLEISQQGREVVLTLSHPTATEAGMPLPKLLRVEIWELLRPVDPVRPEDADEEDNEGEGEPTEAVATARPTLRPPRPQEFEGQAELAATFQGADLSRAVLGERLVFRQPLPADAPPEPRARFYAVRSAVSDRDVSKISNIAGLVPRYPAPEPPAGFEVIQGPRGLRVRWQPAQSIEGRQILGYRIYRRDPQVRFWGNALGTAQPDDRTFLDETARFDTSYIYGVTTVVQRNPLVESAPGGAQEVEYVDTFPPDAPGNPVGLVEEGRVRLVWQAVDAPDLAGYHVYRRTPGQSGDKVHDGILIRTEYVDEALEPGRTYMYRITAVDEEGNEGPPSDEVRAEAR